MSNLYFKIFKLLNCQEEKPVENIERAAHFVACCTGVLLTLSYICEKYLVLKQTVTVPTDGELQSCVKFSV